MNFEISDELKEKIERFFKSNGELKNKLLSGDTDAITQIGAISQKGIKPEDIVEAYESNNMQYLYKQAKKMVTLKEMYKELCDAHALYTMREEDNLEM